MMERKYILILAGFALLVIAIMLILAFSATVPGPILNTGAAVFEPARNIGAPIGF